MTIFRHSELYLPTVWCIITVKLKSSLQSGLAVGLAACLLAGCSSSPQMKRIDEHRDIYEQWPLDARQAVLDGKVEEGMTPDMVKMAIGTPTEVKTRSGAPNTGDDEVWVYRTGGETNDAGMYPGGYPAGYPGSYPYPYPGGYPGSYPGGGGGIVMSPGRGGGVAVIPPAIGIGIGGGMGGSGMPVSRTPVDEREIIFKNGVVTHADPPPETK